MSGAKDDRRDHVRRPIRLKVGYKKAHTLVTEYTKSISKGGCCFESKQPLPVGTLFLFEMYAKGLSLPVEVEGEVVRCEQAADHYDIGIHYVASEERRTALEAALDKIFAEHQWERSRAHPRIPANFFAQGGHGDDRRYLITDISLGGFGVAVPPGPNPAGILPGTPALLVLQEAATKVDLSAEVAWILAAQEGMPQGRIGLKFTKLTPAEHQLVESVQRLHLPIEATLTFFV